MEGLYQVLIRPKGTTGGVSNTGVAVSAMAEANLQGMIYYIKHFNRTGRTCTHADVDLSKVHVVYHQQDMKEYHKDPKVVPTVNPRDWPKTLETVEEYIIGFHGVDGQPLRFGPARSKHGNLGLCPRQWRGVLYQTLQQDWAHVHTRRC